MLGRQQLNTTCIIFKWQFFIRVCLTLQVKIVAAPERQHYAWIGGSIMARLAPQNLWLTKSEYDESGPPVMHKMKNM